MIGKLSSENLLIEFDKRQSWNSQYYCSLSTSTISIRIKIISQRQIPFATIFPCISFKKPSILIIHHQILFESQKMKLSTILLAWNVVGTFGFREFHRQLLRSDGGWSDVQSNRPLSADSMNSQGLEHQMNRNERLKMLMGIMKPQTNGRIINRISDINPWNLYLYTDQ